MAFGIWNCLTMAIFKKETVISWRVYVSRPQRLRPLNTQAHPVVPGQQTKHSQGLSTLENWWVLREHVQLSAATRVSSGQTPRCYPLTKGSCFVLLQSHNTLMLQNEHWHFACNALLHNGALCTLGFWAVYYGVLESKGKLSQNCMTSRITHFSLPFIWFL